MGEWQVIESIRFYWPWALLLWPLPMRWMARAQPAAERASGALFLPFVPFGSVSEGAAQRAAWPLWFWLVWTLLVLALSRPQIAGDPVAPPLVRSTQIVLDISASMGSRDLRTPEGGSRTRLEAASDLLKQWFAAHPHDLAGLVVFGREAFVHLPMTADRGALGGALDELVPGLAGKETALGDALALALTRLPSDVGQERTNAIWLLTDGQQNAGNISVAQAAWLAQRAGVPVHVLGMGAQVDAKSLAALSQQTGGEFATATDRAGLEAFSSRLEAARAKAAGLPAPRFWREMGGAFAALALFLALGALVWRGSVDGDFGGAPSPWRAVIAPALQFQLGIGNAPAPGASRISRRRLPVGMAVLSLLVGGWLLLVARDAPPHKPVPGLTVLVVELSPELPAEAVQALPGQMRAALDSAPPGEVALVVYGDDAYTVAPPTADRATLALWFDELKPDVLPSQGNRPDRAVALAQQLMARATGTKRVVWLGASVPTPLPPPPAWGGVTTAFSRVGPDTPGARALSAWLGGGA